MAALSRRIVLAALLSAASSAFGQVAPVYNGNALDANTMVGANGANRPVRGYAPVNGNDIITRNVDGLGYFHGRVGYSSPYEFRGNLPSASLDRFNAASTGGYNPAQNLGQMRSFYTPSSLVSTANGQINPGTAMSLSPTRLDSRILTPGSINPNSSPTADNAGGPSRLSSASLAPPTVDYQHVSTQRLTPSVDDSENDALFGLRRTLQPEPIVTRQTPDQPDGALVQPSMVNPQAKPTTMPGGDMDPNAVPPALPDQVNDQVRNKLVRDVAPAGRLSRGPGEMPDALGQFPIVTVSPLFADQLATLRYNPNARTPAELAGAGPDGAVPDMTRFSLPDRSPLSKMDLDPLTHQPKPPKNGTATSQPGLPRMIIPKVQTPITPLPAAEYILRADESMRAGKYLQAADTYQAALRAEPNNVAALAGRAHAELAGGLYESAVFDLKFLFNIDPAHMTAHYNLISAIGLKRLDYLEKDLQELDRKNPRSPADFLLAYVYYQTGRPDDLKVELDTWTKHQPEDPWPAALRRSWLEEKTDKDKATDKPAAGAGAGAAAGG